MSLPTRCTTLQKPDMAALIQRLQANSQQDVEKHYALLALEASMRGLDPLDRPTWFRAMHEEISDSIADFAAASPSSPSSSSSPRRRRQSKADRAATQELVLYGEAAQRIVDSYESDERGSYGRILRESAAEQKEKKKSEEEDPSGSVVSGQVKNLFRHAESMARAAQRLVDRLAFLGSIGVAGAGLRDEERAGILRFVADAAEYRHRLVGLAALIDGGRWAEFVEATKTLPRYVWPLISEDDGLVFFPCDLYPELDSEGDWDEDEESPVLVEAQSPDITEWSEDECYLSCSSDL